MPCLRPRGSSCLPARPAAIPAAAQMWRVKIAAVNPAVLETISGLTLSAHRTRWSAGIGPAGPPGRARAAMQSATARLSLPSSLAESCCSRTQTLLWAMASCANCLGSSETQYLKSILSISIVPPDPDPRQGTVSRRPRPRQQGPNSALRRHRPQERAASAPNFECPGSACVWTGRSVMYYIHSAWMAKDTHCSGQSLASSAMVRMRSARIDLSTGA